MSKSRDNKAQLASSETVLKARPHRNEAMTLADRGGGRLLAQVPMRRPFWLIPPLSWLLPYSTHRKVELDPVGAKLLKMCNGRRTVERIIEKFAADNNLSFREAQLPVMQFLQSLSQRGLIAVVTQERTAGK